MVTDNNVFPNYATRADRYIVSNLGGWSNRSVGINDAIISYWGLRMYD